MPTLQEQLLKAGLIDKKKAKQVQHQQRQAQSQKKAKRVRGEAVVDEAALAREQAVVEKAARDRELNRQRQAELDAKALLAQIAQLVKLNRVDDGKGELAYQFSDDKVIGRVMVTAEQKRALAAGQLAIAKLGKQYSVISSAVADKVRQRNAEVIVSQHEKSESAESISPTDDPYAEFEIPEDFDW